MREGFSFGSSSFLPTVSCQHLHSVLPFLSVIFIPIFHPHSPVNSPKQNVEAYAAALADEIQLIQSTLQFRSAFAEALKEVKSLKSVQVDEGWFGLGALRYTPPYIKDDVVSMEVEQDVNELNSMMVDNLTEQDVNLFRHGVVAESNRTCILVGVVSASFFVFLFLFLFLFPFFLIPAHPHIPS